MKKGMDYLMSGIESEVQYTRSLLGKSALAPTVMQAMAKVERDQFVPADLQFAAFDNGPLSIGHGQTISQPYIVALMTDLLALKPEYTVLEIGTGSGYQSAVLSLLCKQVYTVELIQALSEMATARLKRLGYNNIEARHGNGYRGWLEHAPYDGIIVTAAAPYIPEALIEQLRPGGKLVIPLGSPYSPQELVLMSKDQQGHTTTEDILGVSFVPLVDTRITE